MAQQSKRQCWRSIHKRYHRATRKEKTMILEEFCKVCGYNRKYAIWLSGRPLSHGTARTAVSRGSVTYGKATISVLAKSGKPRGTCAPSGSRRRYRSGFPWVKKHFEIDGQLQKDLLAISSVRWIGGFALQTDFETSPVRHHSPGLTSQTDDSDKPIMTM